jgi:hypothetical protein
VIVMVFSLQYRMIWDRLAVALYIQGDLVMCNIHIVKGEKKNYTSFAGPFVFLSRLDFV